MPKRKVMFPSQGRNFTREELMRTPMLEPPMWARFVCDSFQWHDTCIGGLESLVNLNVYHYFSSISPQWGTHRLLLKSATNIQFTILLNDPIPPLASSPHLTNQPQSAPVTHRKFKQCIQSRNQVIMCSRLEPYCHRKTVYLMI